MPRIKPLSKEEVSDELKGIYSEMEKGFGFVPNLFATLAYSPEALSAILKLYEAISKKSGIPPKLQEISNLVVSHINKCNYCLTHHKKMAKVAGLNNEEIEKILKGDWSNFSHKEKAVLEYAKAVTEDAENVSEELFSALQKFFSNKEIVNLTLIIGLMNVFNRFNGALEVELER